MLLEFRRVFWHLYLQELLRAELMHLFLCPERLIEKLMSIYMMEQLWCVFSPVNFSWAQRQANQLRKTGCNMHQEQRNLVMFPFSDASSCSSIHCVGAVSPQFWPPLPIPLSGPSFLLQVPHFAFVPLDWSSAPIPESLQPGTNFCYIECWFVPHNYFLSSFLER